MVGSRRRTDPPLRLALGHAPQVASSRRSPPLAAMPDDQADASASRSTCAAVRLAAPLLDRLGEGTVAYDRDLRHRAWSRWMEVHTGIPASRALGASCDELFPRLRESGFTAGVRGVPAGAPPEVSVLSIPAAFDGPAGRLRARLEPLRQEAGEVVGVLACFRDASAEASAEASADAAPALPVPPGPRLEAVRPLAGGVAHDFSNLLTVVRGNAQRMLDSGLLAGELQLEVEELVQAAERAATRTRQLLAFSRQQVLQPRVLDLNAAVNAAWLLLEGLVGGAVTMERRLGESVWPVSADPVQFERVLLRLVQNASEAMPDGGPLTVSTGNLTADGAFARAHAPMPPGAYVWLAVADGGTGMDAATMSRIFDPFFTTKGPGRGTGMGLSTVYGVVKLSGGYIWVESTLGKGTTFTVYLPRVAASRPPAPTAVQPAGAPRGAQTVRVVEDEPLVRALTRRGLERAGYLVHEAANGEEGLARVRELGEALRLVITDLVMPVMGGRELAAALQRERPSLDILCMSRCIHERDAHLDGGGTSTFLQKAFTLDELRQRVRRLLDEVATAA